MHFEASTSSSPPATDISPINAATDVKKRSRSDSTGHPLYGGVRRRSSGKWVSEIREPNTRSRIWLGTFANPEMAAAAHDAAALALHGAAATLNFPESAHRLPPAASSAHADIQRAALEAAREFSTPASSSTLSNNAGDSTSIFVDKENGDVSAGGDGGGRAEFLDEEAIFNMPLLLDSMAEGMLLTPPSMKKGFSWNQDDAYEYDDGIVDFTLWKH